MSIGGIFQNLREYLIVKSGNTVANKIIPLKSLNELRNLDNKQTDFREKSDNLLFGYFGKVLHFGSEYSSFTTQKKCTPGKSYPCKGTCISVNRNCLNPIEGQAGNYAAFLALQDHPDASTTTIVTGTTTPTKKSKSAPKSSTTTKSSSKTKQTKEQKQQVEQENQKQAPEDTKSNTPEIKQPETESQTGTKSSSDENFLKPKDYNPYAIKDLSIDDFNQYLVYKAALNFNIESYLPENDKSKRAYTSAVVGAISRGDVVPQDFIDKQGIKLNKKQIQRLEENKEELERRRQFVAPIDKAINYSLADEKANKDYKSVMTAEEAKSYTDDSFMGNLSFYHANSIDVIDNIEKEGAKPEKNESGMYGRGFYLATSKEESDYYASLRLGQGKKAALIETKVRIKNPLVVDSRLDFEIQKGGIGTSDAMADFAKAKGYDSIYVRSCGYLVLLDKKQVTTVNRSDYSKSDEEMLLKQLKQQPSFADAHKRNEESITGSALKNLKYSDVN